MEDDKGMRGMWGQEDPIGRRISHDAGGGQDDSWGLGLEHFIKFKDMKLEKKIDGFM